MSRLRHAKGLPKMAGALSGVHRLQVDKPHPFKPIEERKHGGKTHHVDGKAEHHRLGRKRGGSVKKKSDGGNVTTVGKTKKTGPDDYPTVSGKPLLADSKYNAPADKYFALPAKSYGWFGVPSEEKSEERLESRSRGGKVDTPDRGTKHGTPVQDTPMAGTESGYGGKFAHGKGHVEDSLRRGGHAHHDGEKVGWLHKKHGGKLTYQERKHLKSSSFVFPGERKYPLPDESHGRNALARVSQFGSPSEKAKVRAAVHKKFPNIGK